MGARINANEYCYEITHGLHHTFEPGNFVFEMGETIRNVKLLYKTHGKLNDKKDNAILFRYM